MLGGSLMLIDTLWGVVPVLGIGFEPLLDVPLDISLVAGLPAYMLDAWSRVRIVVFLPALYLLRWFVWTHIGRAPHHWGSPPWGGTVLLIVASALLQWSKLQTSPGGIDRR
jgi:hypothetical protein